MAEGRLTSRNSSDASRWWPPPFVPFRQMVLPPSPAPSSTAWICALCTSVWSAWTSSTLRCCGRPGPLSRRPSSRAWRSLSWRQRRRPAATRGPYIIPTGRIPPEFLDPLRAHLANLPRLSSPLFPGLTGTAVKVELRHTDPALEEKSLRRGALQVLSAAPGMTNDKLRHLSGHASLASLFRHLNWGMRALHLRQEAVKAAGSALGQ